MGKSPSIEDLAKKDQAFNDYMTKLQADLTSSSDALVSKIQGEVDSFYDTNKFTDAKTLVAGESCDFQHKAEFSLANLQTIINAIAGSVFAIGAPPPKVEVDEDAKADLTRSVGQAAEKMANLELYIAGKVFDVLSSVVLTFGTSTEMRFHSDSVTKPLGYGMQLFTGVAVRSHKSESFFRNETILEYFYVYRVKFSTQQAGSEVNQGLVKTYSDQIAAYQKRMESLVDLLAADKIDIAEYTKLTDQFDILIEKSQAKLRELQKQSLAKRAQAALAGTRGR